MATLQHLTIQQIDDVLQAAVERHIPATITVRGENGTWSNLRSRLVALQAEHIHLEMPEGPDGRPFGLRPADKAGVSFKFKHHKHIFTGTVAGTEEGHLADGTAAVVLSVCCPTKMHRMQRRAFLRADVPPNRVVRASFWLGGRDAEPAGTGPGKPVWSGRVANISAGGFQVACEADAADVLDVGETVGVRVHFGVGEEAVYADAQFRHAQAIEGKLHLGFQFVGLAQSAEGRDALQSISVKAAQFQRESTATQRART